jgi:hypothetical protein
MPMEDARLVRDIRDTHKGSALLADSMCSLTDLSDELLVFVSLLLRNEAPCPPSASPDEWRSLLSVLDYHGMLPLFYRQAFSPSLEDQLPEDIVQLLRNKFLGNVRRHALLTRQLAGIISALQKEDISPLVLKGLAMAESVYPDPATRPIGDIDLLVLPRQMTRSRELLEASGYRCAARYFAASEDLYCQEDFIPVAGRGTRVNVDLHWRLHRFLGVTRKPSTEDLFARAVPVNLASCSFKILGPVDSLIHSAFHASLNHNRFMRLIWVYDINLFAHELRGPEDWKMLQTRSVDWCARKAVEDCLRLAEAWCGLMLPSGFDDFSSWPAPTEHESDLFSGQSLKKERSLDVFRLHWPRSLGPIQKARALLPLLFPPVDILKSRYPGSRKWQIPLRYMQRWSNWLKHAFIP